MYDVHSGSYSDLILQLEDIIKQAKTGRQSQQSYLPLYSEVLPPGLNTSSIAFID